MRWFVSLFAWRWVSCTGVWLYEQNAVTGHRRARRIMPYGHQPQDTAWLVGDSDSPPGRPLNDQAT